MPDDVFTWAELTSARGKVLNIRKLFIALGCFAAFAAPSAASAGDFDGITVLEFADEAGADAIRGIGSIPGLPSRLVTFVSEAGTYAAVVGSRGCAAWAVEGSYAGDQINFGLGASVVTIRLSDPHVCQPFTLTWTSGGTVRIQADGNFFSRTGGPLGANARPISYDAPARVVAHVPLVSLDWDLPIFAQHDIEGVQIGPLELAKTALHGRAKISIGRPDAAPGIGPKFEARLTGRDGNPVSVTGYVALAERLAEPSDVLISIAKGENINPVTRDAFDAAAMERYGKPSFSEKVPKYGKTHQVWLYDLSGRQLRRSDSAPDNCLATAEWWQEDAGNHPVNRDIGPWGCSLVMAIDTSASSSPINQYLIRAISGYGAAINHFHQRLHEMEAVRRNIETSEGAKPRL